MKQRFIRARVEQENKVFYWMEIDDQLVSFDCYAIIPKRRNSWIESIELRVYKEENSSIHSKAEVQLETIFRRPRKVVKIKLRLKLKRFLRIPCQRILWNSSSGIESSRTQVRELLLFVSSQTVPSSDVKSSIKTRSESAPNYESLARFYANSCPHFRCLHLAAFSLSPIKL